MTRRIREGAPQTPAAGVALRFASVPLTGEPAWVAAACADAARELLGCAVRLVVPASPVALHAGDPPEGLVMAARFPTTDGEGELWTAPSALSDVDSMRSEIAGQITRIWDVQEERAARAAELDRFHFELNGLRQVAHTLAAVRGVEETEQLVLDSVGEVFFARWAALYRTRDDEYRCRAVRSPSGETLADSIPASVIRALTPQSGAPVVPPEGAEIRAHLPPTIAVAAPLDLGEGGAGLLALGPRLTDAPYTSHDLALLEALADGSAIALRNADMVHRLRTQALTDKLTGCRNRRGFDELLEVEFARARRYGRPLSLALLDIDNFKKINDELGHDAGDYALQRIGEMLRNSVRITDRACRYGGEEFALLFPETPSECIIQLAERVRGRIGSLVPDDRMPYPITVSIGVATFPDHATEAHELVRAADQALYRAKMRGRNRVETA